MKKIHIVLGAIVLVGTFALSDVATAKALTQEAFVEINSNDVITISSVTRIIRNGRGGQIKNFSFSGKYDTETGIMRVYDKKGNLVQSGRPQSSDISGYSYHVGDYYFNM